MEKNIIVTDRNGKVIGSTYPKRARGLVKNGRAEYVSDREICLLHTHPPAVDNKTTEVNTMSKTIDFNAREFRFDETCQSLDNTPVNAGQRAFVTMSFGNAEVWEIGDWQWTWSQIKRKITLEKNTDYSFSFSMEGGICSTDDAVTVAHIVPKGNWEERYTFLLDHNKFMPEVCVLDGKELLRSFVLPFNSGEYEEWVIILAAHHAVTRFFAPVSYETVSRMQSVTYQQFVGGEISEEKSSNGAVSDVNMAVENCTFDESGFVRKLTAIGAGCNAGFENDTVKPDALPAELDAGVPAEGCNLAFENCTVTSRAMSLIISKLGNGCNICMENVTVTEDGFDDLVDIGEEIEGANIALENVTLPKAFIDLFYDKMGDTSTLSEVGVEDYEVYEHLSGDLVAVDTETGEISPLTKEELEKAEKALADKLEASEKALADKLIEETDK